MCSNIRPVYSTAFLHKHRGHLPTSFHFSNLPYKNVKCFWAQPHPPPPLSLLSKKKSCAVVKIKSCTCCVSWQWIKRVRVQALVLFLREKATVRIHRRLDGSQSKCERGGKGKLLALPYNIIISHTRQFIITIQLYLWATCFDCFQSSSGPAKSKSKAYLICSALWDPKRSYMIL
jgi:hypothetical protein